MRVRSQDRIKMLLTGPDDLPNRLLSIALVKAITSNAGFTHARGGAVRALADITTLYLARLGDASKQRAELSGRTRPSLRDAVEAVADYDCSVGNLILWLRDQAVDQPPEPSAEEQRFRAAARLIEGAVSVPVLLTSQGLFMIRQNRAVCARSVCSAKTKWRRWIRPRRAACCRRDFRPWMSTSRTIRPMNSCSRPQSRWANDEPRPQMESSRRGQTMYQHTCLLSLVPSSSKRHDRRPAPRRQKRAR